MFQQCIQRNFTSHTALSTFSVHDSLDCRASGTTSSIHHGCSQHVQVQHKMPPLELISLKTGVRFVKNSSSNRKKPPSLTFFNSTATELFGNSNDESVCVFSSKRIDHCSRIKMAKFNVQTRHYGSGCFSFFLSSQVQGLLFFFTESTMSIFLYDWVIVS